MSEQAPPVPEALLVPLLDEAGEVVRTLEPDDVPPALRALRGFDRRGLAHGPARRQLRRALESDETFRERVVERFVGRPEVVALLDAWEPAAAVAAAADAADRDDLALLASALWAARPEGAAFGLGALSAAHERRRREWGDAADAQALEQRLAEHEEAVRRAETARRTAEAEAARLDAALHDERRSRRAREEQAEAEADAARRHAEALEVEVDRARDAADTADQRAGREAKRVHALEDDLRRVRAELAEARAAREEEPPTRLGPDDARILADAADAARRLAGSLDALVGRAGSRPAPQPPRPSAEPSSRPSRERPLARRVQPTLPPGLVADSVAGLTAMLRSPGLVLVVDGYNVSQRAWHDSTPSEQRTRLAMALTQLHLRYGCDVTAVFDGDGTEGVPPLRRPGLRVLFSSGDEEADEVVVRVIADLPKRVPVVAVSSDAWVREHADEEGACVVSADTLLGAFGS